MKANTPVNFLFTYIILSSVRLFRYLKNTI